ILDVLCSLAKLARVYPLCYTLKNIRLSATQPLAAGGYADIYKVPYKDQTMCIKVLRLFGDDRTQALISVREILLWAHVSHDNVLPFYGIYLGEDVGRPCLVSPWMENGNLHEYLAHSKPDVPRALLVQDVIEGLLYLHQAGVVHGDLKARNILISSDKRALIADFGMSTVAMTTKRESSPGGVTGYTIRFTAPEIMKRNIKPTKMSDVWSFGCLCLEVFTGKAPFYWYKLDQCVVMALYKDEQPNQPPGGDDIFNGLDGWIPNIMEGCLKITPKERPQCEEIRNIFAENVNQLDRSKTPARAMDKLAFWEDMKAQSGIEPNHRRVEELMRNVSSGSSGSIFA
ncbi:kinase-like protein, partial [Macrolepiota fuliginosa MF-IS2]